MGIRGLKTFLENENQIVPINVVYEVMKWKRTHRDEQPTLLIDFLSLCNGIVAQFKNEFVFGGRHRHIQEYFKFLLIHLKQKIGFRLVFFSDYNIQEGKTKEWLSRRKLEFKRCTEVFDWIGDEREPEKMPFIPHKLALKSTCYEMEMIALDFGEMHYTIKHECDMEIMQYAKKHANVMAIVSADTDFLIFRGPWKLWSSDDIKFKCGALTTLEYKKNICSLTQRQLPLLATLVGNDFTKAYYGKLKEFHSSLGSIEEKVKNVARFIRQLDGNELTDIHLTQIFGIASDEIRMLIKDSLKSYIIDDSPTIIDDPIANKLSGTPSYPPYMTIMSPIHGINMNYYDMRGTGEGINLSMLLIDWMKRKIGVVRKQNNNESFTFTLMAKKSLNEDFMAYRETPIYPEFSVPPLDDLYLKNTDPDIIEQRYKILGWIMTLPAEIVRKIRDLRFFSAKRVTLYALVKNGLLDVCEADGILYTEIMSFYECNEKVEYPKKIYLKYIRAAQIYNIAFSHVRQNFEIAGLLPIHTKHTDNSFAEIVLYFDGVYFHSLMGKIAEMEPAKREELFAPIKKYRIYAND